MGLYVQKFITALVIIVTALIGLSAILLECSEARCWTPAHFTPQHVKYTNTYCTKSKEYYTISSDLPEQLQQPSITIKTAPSFAKHLTTEIMAVILYLVLSYQVLSLTEADKGILLSLNPGASNNQQDDPSARNKHIKDLASSYGTAVLYIIIQLAFVIAMFVICSDFKKGFASLREDNIVICDMYIRNLGGNIQRYSIQCHLPSQAPYTILHDANKAVCILAGVIVLFHIVHVFLMSPWWHRSALQATLTDNKVIKKPQEVGFSFIISDLYMISWSANASHAIFSGGDPSAAGGPGSREVPPYEPTAGPPGSSTEQGMYPKL